MAQLWQTFLTLVVTPFQHLEMVWGIVPLYFGWVVNEVTSSKASFRTALQTGFVFTWAAAQWLYPYFRRWDTQHESITPDVLMAVNMVVTLLVLALGVLALFCGIRRKYPKYCSFLGHSRFSAYFTIMMFPMQAHYLQWTWLRLGAIAAFAIPVWVIVHFGLMPLRK